MSRHKKRTAPMRKQPPKRPFPWIALAGAALLIVLVAVGAILIRGNASTAGKALSEISVEQAFARREAGAFILDVRTPQEWNEAHIPDSTLIPLDELASRLSEVPRDQEVVVVCRSGNRSQEGRDILQKAGFSQVVSMAGGLNQWRAAGYPTVSGP